MLTDKEFNALIPRQLQLIKEKDLNKNGFNPGQALFMIITEMAEATNAHRKFKIIPTKDIPTEEGNFKVLSLDYESLNKVYELGIKGTFQEELGDIYIRLASYCACRSIEIDTDGIRLSQKLMKAETLPEQFMILSGMLSKAHYHLDEDVEETYISLFFAGLNYVVLNHKVKVKTFIDIKMKVNESMEILNGKAY